MKTRLLNFAMYQAGWFACVFGAADGFPWLGAGTAAVLVVVHCVLAGERGAEWALILWVGVVGTGVDSLLMHFQVFRYDSGQWIAWLCPAWMSVLWMQFATLLRYSLRWLEGRYALGALLGATGGPLAYAAGIRLGAAQFGRPLAPSLLTLAGVWLVVTPALLWMEARLRSSRGTGTYRL